MTRWLTPKEAAAYCRVDEVTLRRAVQRKLLCAFRINGGKRVRYADTQRRVIAVRPVISEFSYATALHEIGHVADQRRESGFTKTISGTVYADHPGWELAAWRWAGRNAKRWTRKMHDGLADRLINEAHRYRQQTDGDGDLSPFTMCIRESAGNITDRPLTFDEVDKQIGAIEIVTKTLEPPGSVDIAAHLETRVKDLLLDGRQ